MLDIELKGGCWACVPYSLSACGFRFLLGVVSWASSAWGCLFVWLRSWWCACLLTVLCFKWQLTDVQSVHGSKWATREFTRTYFYRVLDKPHNKFQICKEEGQQFYAFFCPCGTWLMRSGRCRSRCAHTRAWAWCWKTKGNISYPCCAPLFKLRLAFAGLLGKLSVIGDLCDGVDGGNCAKREEQVGISIFDRRELDSHFCGCARFGGLECIAFFLCKTHVLAWASSKSAVTLCQKLLRKTFALWRSRVLDEVIENTFLEV